MEYRKVLRSSVGCNLDIIVAYVIIVDYGAIVGCQTVRLSIASYGLHNGNSFSCNQCHVGIGEHVMNRTCLHATRGDTCDLYHETTGSKPCNWSRCFSNNWRPNPRNDAINWRPGNPDGEQIYGIPDNALSKPGHLLCYSDNRSHFVIVLFPLDG